MQNKSTIKLIRQTKEALYQKALGVISQEQLLQGLRRVVSEFYGQQNFLPQLLTNEKE